MIIIKDVKLVAHSYNSNRGIDGVFKKDNNYYITFCHGAKDGSIFLQMEDFLYTITPYLIVDFIRDILHYNISKQGSVFITPCHPNKVVERYSKELIENNISVIGNWNDNTMWTPVIENSVYETKKIISNRNGIEYSKSRPDCIYSLQLDSETNFKIVNLSKLFSDEIHGVIFI